MEECCLLAHSLTRSQAQAQAQVQAQAQAQIRLRLRLMLRASECVLVCVNSSTYLLNALWRAPEPSLALLLQQNIGACSKNEWEVRVKLGVVVSLIRIFVSLGVSFQSVLKQPGSYLKIVLLSKGGTDFKNENLVLLMMKRPELSQLQRSWIFLETHYLHHLL